jgi:outer membrane protein OmpA-like peptidoglycan-associated protein
MRFAPLHASLMSLALFALAGPAEAAATETERAIILAQAETPVAEPEPLPVEAEQPPPPEVQPEMQPEPQPEPQQEAAPEVQPEPQPDMQQQAAPEPAPAAAPQGSDEVALFLQSVRPASELSEDELRSQMQQAMAFAETDGLSKDQRRGLRDVIREARAELKSRANSSAAEAETPPEPQKQAEPPPQPETQPEPAVVEQPQQVEPPVAEPPVAEQPPQPEQQPQAKTVEVDPALEAEARALLADDVNVTEMKRRDLRKRLATMRDLLASDRLTPDTREALRKRLAEDREVLRSDVSRTEAAAAQPPAETQPQAETQAQPPAQPEDNAGNGTVNNTVIINNNTTITNTEIQIALNDRRAPDQLEDDELVRRIDIYRDVVVDDRYDLEEREAWRRALERDRRYLRRQMLAERAARAERLRSGDFELNVQIYDDYEPGRDYQDDVFAAEVEDDELADVLAAPPRRQVERRYTVDEIERSSTARDSVARIEIDTVHFGFGEGFLREEEIDKLDRIARVLERILARNPDEVFLLEGHTDAVGSAGSNLQLSRQRAQAVKEALTTYYVIPAENLRTAGLGERYLKIPTLDAEAENRRVSLARITSLLGQAN